MTPYYEHAGITIYHGDCRDVLSSIERVDLLLSDPPYGVANDCDYSRLSGGKKWAFHPSHAPVHGDDQPFDPSHLLQYPRVILWGGNYDAQRLPVGTSLVWLKKADQQLGTFLSDGEIAWQKGGRGVYLYRHIWSGVIRETENGERSYHPTQKPIALMKWCIKRSKLPPGSVIVDPYMGSGPTLLAAKELGFPGIGIEMEERYCEIAAKRLSQEVMTFDDRSAGAEVLV